LKLISCARQQVFDQAAGVSTTELAVRGILQRTASGLPMPVNNGDKSNHDNQ